jgi:hypothetical protein
MNSTSRARAVVLAQPTGPALHRPPRPHRRGVCYDVGRSFRGGSTRPELDPSVVQRELEIIRKDLHCNAVSICGTNLARIRVAGAQALSLGLEAWLCPELFEHDQATFTDRIAAPTFREQIRGTHVTATLNAFLARAAEAARSTFGGLVTYAAAPTEPVDWSLFDVVCIDICRDAVNRDSFGELLEPAFAYRKDVVISEVGCCTYSGAQDDGGMGWAIIDYSASPPEIDGDYVRDEGLQASELTEMLKLLECRGVTGIFVMTFVSPTLIHTPDPRTDLDMASFSIVKSYQNRRGATYPDLRWEPKQAFCTVAEYFAQRTS